MKKGSYWTKWNEALRKDEPLVLTFGTSFRFWQSYVLHEVEGERNVVNFLIVAFWGQMEITERDEESFEQPEEQREENSVVKLVVQVRHFQVNFAQMFVDERDERLEETSLVQLKYENFRDPKRSRGKSDAHFFDDTQFVVWMIEKYVERVTFATHPQIVVGRGDFFSHGPVNQLPILFPHND